MATAVILALGLARLAAPAVSPFSGDLGLAARTATVTIADPARPGAAAHRSSAAVRAAPAPPAAVGAATAAAAVGAAQAHHAVASSTTRPPVAPAPFSTTPAPVSTPPGAVKLTAPPIRLTSPGGYGCAAALAYLAANQAPGFVDTCGPHSAGPGRAGQTWASTDQGVTTGVISIACPAPIVYQNEASNSWKYSGASDLPLDPWGGVPIHECRPGDIAPG